MLDINNKLFFWIQNIYNNIIDLYNKVNLPIIINLMSKHEINFLILNIKKWILCLNKKNNYSCNICKNCNLIKNNKNYNFFNINLYNEINVKDIILIFLNKINYNKDNDFNKIIYISNIEYITNEVLTYILYNIKIKNFFFIFSCKNIKNVKKELIKNCILYKTNYLNDKFLYNYLYHKYDFSKTEQKFLLNICNYSFIKLLKIIDKKIFIKRNEFFEIIKFSIKKKNFINLLKFFIDNKNVYINKLFIIFIIDVIKYKLKINDLINIDKIEIIKNFLFIIEYDYIYKIFKNFILYEYYLINEKFINNDILLIYNILYINKIFKD